MKTTFVKLGLILGAVGVISFAAAGPGYAASKTEKSATMKMQTKHHTTRHAMHSAHAHSKKHMGTAKTAKPAAPTTTAANAVSPYPIKVKPIFPAAPAGK